jgi:hypothetical protein
MAARRQRFQTRASRVSEEEDDMRAIECPCGRHFEAADDEELFRLCREHATATIPR